MIRSTALLERAYRRVRLSTRLSCRTAPALLVSDGNLRCVSLHRFAKQCEDALLCPRADPDGVCAGVLFPGSTNGRSAFAAAGGIAAQGGSVRLPPLWLRRLIFWGLVGLILGYLSFLKYVMPTLWWRGAILKYYALPLGVSYFSFKLIDMLVYSVQSDQTQSGHGFEFLCSVFIFPTAAAGPIERYEHFQQNARSISRRSDDLLQGSTRIIYGLIKRFVIVESLFSDQWRYVTRGAMWEHLLHPQSPCSCDAGQHSAIPSFTSTSISPPTATSPSAAADCLAFD